jgi:hypothetical protein
MCESNLTAVLLGFYIAAFNSRAILFAEYWDRPGSLRVFLISGALLKSKQSSQISDIRNDYEQFCIFRKSYVSTPAFSRRAIAPSLHTADASLSATRSSASTQQPGTLYLLLGWYRGRNAKAQMLPPAISNLLYHIRNSSLLIVQEGSPALNWIK